jgi:hypothetical protein
MKAPSRDIFQQTYEFSCDLLDMLGGSDGGMITQIHATLDDVGNCKKDGISAVAGYVAYKEAWNKFNWRWMMTLKELNEPYLHTAHYLNKFWLSDKTITDDDICLILAPFIEAVKATLLAEQAVPICVITECEAYEKLSPADKKYIRPPDEHSFEIAVMLSCAAIRHPLHISDWVSVQMDESDNAARLYERYRILKADVPEMREHLSSLCFCDDRRHPPVQAADMLANIVLKSWRNAQSGEKLPRAIQEITVHEGNLRLTLAYYDLENLQRLAEMRRKQKERFAMQ